MKKEVSGPEEAHIFLAKCASSFDLAFYSVPVALQRFYEHAIWEPRSACLLPELSASAA
jgi:hypothetical protein